MKYELAKTGKFKKGLKLAIKRGLNIQLLKEVIETLQNDIPLAPKFEDHDLKGSFKGFRECHVQPDWLLIYKKDKKLLILTLVATGTHSDLLDI